MLRYTETAKTLVAFFDDAEIRGDVQIIAAGNGLLELVRLAESTRKGVTLSFHGVQLVSSVILGSIVLASASAKHRRVVYRIADVAPHIMEMFRAARLHKVLRFERLRDAEELRESSVPVPLPQKEAGPPCPECGKALATKLAKQCLACGADWH
jgi:anti-anti-sigma regulatory factor